MATSLYRFKDITAVPGAKELVDIVLSKTQRKTPTEVHKQFKIARIRAFYMRKVKFCQQCYHDKLGTILSEFPRLDEIHPFYADLCNVLYDRDHYKLALGQCNTVKGIIDSIAKDYVRLMKYADSLYKCKMLKRAALGRMCTAVLKLKACLSYLEEVRQHLGRLPSINPNTRTLILTGYPNVGKSSFMNLVSNANVEVQPYAFTTKSLYVGHFDYAYTRWQIIDTPGILDHPLEERNTIEMTAVTALAHIQASILYVLDVSEECGFTLEAQVKLFHSIKPLFRNKPLIILVNKVDSIKLEDLADEEKRLIDSMSSEADPATFLTTSTLTGQGVDNAKNKACDLLLEQRVQKKIETKQGEKLMERLFVASVPPEDIRPPIIPDSVRLARANLQLNSEHVALAPKRTERDLEAQFGGAGVYSVDLRKHHMLASEDWKYDIYPEIFDGKNVSDFVDADIDTKLQELEREEELLLLQDQPMIDNDWLAAQETLKKLHLKANRIRMENRLNKTRSGPILPHKKVKKTIAKPGSLLPKVNGLTNRDSKSSKERHLRGTNFTSSEAESATSGYPIESAEPTQSEKAKELALLRRTLRLKSAPGKAHNLTNRSLLGLSRLKDQQKMEKIRRLGQRPRNRKGLAGDADHFIGTKKPKHLFAGKRGKGKLDRR